jgi:16S rRNA (uracil1498-N3)-methyltransferase
MHTFYSPDIVENKAVLSSEESAHCLRVLRLGKGDQVIVIDGKGGMFEAVITEPDTRACRLEITKVLPSPAQRKHKIHIAIAPTKNMDRFEWFVEKSIEIGIDIITPLLCQRSERRVLKTDRLHKLIISTMKQAMVTQLPVLNELMPYNQFVKTMDAAKDNRFIAHCGESSRKELKQALLPQSDAVVLIGPEGDFTAEEVQLAVESGFKPVTLGNNRLRTETAGIVACHIAILRNI